MNWLAQMEARRLVLSLREMLVRHDENAKADTLMRDCVPYLCDGDPEIERARADQAAMVMHLHSSMAYAEYYRSNVHERPFEDQYGIKPEEAHEFLPRVAILRDALENQPAENLLDLACNDGWLAANLAHGLTGYRRYRGIDLNPGCIERAVARDVPAAAFFDGDLRRAFVLTGGGGHDVVVAFEVIEHVRSPEELLEVMVSCCTPGGRLFLSTPNGATEHGDLPRWWHVEPKGHVRVYTPESFYALVSRYGDPGPVMLGPDGVMVVQVDVPPQIVATDAGQSVVPDRAGDRGDSRPPAGPGPAER